MLYFLEYGSISVNSDVGFIMLSCLKLHLMNIRSSSNLLLSLGRLQQGQATGNTVQQVHPSFKQKGEERQICKIILSFVALEQETRKPTTSFHLLP